VEELVKAKEQWESTFEAWRAQRKTNLQMMESVQSLTDPSVTGFILDYLDDWALRVKL
jgi:hypothetical protein